LGEALASPVRASVNSKIILFFTLFLSSGASATLETPPKRRRSLNIQYAQFEHLRHLNKAVADHSIGAWP
jgi:hypothetical protein